MKQAAVLSYSATPAEKVRPGLQRRLVYTRDLMTAVLDFENGPWPAPDPFHSHPHEQITYLAEGEILCLAEGQEPIRMTAGDLFAVPSGVPHSIQLLSARARLVDTFNPPREDFLPRLPDSQA